MGVRSVDELQDLFARHGVTQLYVKQLAPKQDNEKNQIYLGSGLDGATNLFPAAIVARSPSESTEKRKSSQGKPKVEAQIDLAWLDRNGSLHDAPHARIIDYFQYPEIRFSGFMRGCDEPPDALRRNNQAQYGVRILLLGISNTGRTIGFVITEAEDELVSVFPDLPELRALPTLRVLTFLGAAGSSPTELLLSDLAAAHHAGWHPSIILKPRESGPIPFRGNQGGGYTLEAILGVPANADHAPDKHGYEIKTYSKGKISLMTPTADTGYGGDNPFRDFMAKYGRPGQANDGRTVFTGVHRSGRVNPATGCELTVDGYDAAAGSFSADTNDIQVSIRKVETGEVISGWSFKKLADSWNKKHSSAAYVARERRPHEGDDGHDHDYRFLADVFICEGTDIWRLLRTIHSGEVYFDPAHTIYASGEAKVRPQWRINTSRLAECLSHLYREVQLVTLP
ncbi:MAG: hypothetical protein K0U72_11820 [Gammaproteobacteria bacterium]|nr:hypothetical protein [Gammaproteobacteria bacterium]